MIRNTNGTLKVFAFNASTGAPTTGDAANITCKVSLDGGARVALADTNPAEMEDGFYLFDVTAAECNGVTADFFPESTTNNVQVICAEHNRYLLPQGGVATLNNQNTIISSLGGSGAVAKTVTITNGASPLDGVEVWVSTDAGGSNVVAGTLSTNSFGQVTFMLDAGNYYVWTQLAGYNFTNPTSITVP